jgi:hypothetical protein
MSQSQGLSTVPNVSKSRRLDEVVIIESRCLYKRRFSDDSNSRIKMPHIALQKRYKTTNIANLDLALNPHKLNWSESNYRD